MVVSPDKDRMASKEPETNSTDIYLSKDIMASGDPEKFVIDISLGKDGMVSIVPEEMTCVNNCEDNSFLMEALQNEYTLNRSEVAVENMIDAANPNGKGNSEDESQDTTEDSSSFGDTNSGVGNGAVPSDVEVESELHDHGASSLGFNVFGDSFRARKKKLTEDWKKFVQPLKWRCLWAELRIRELQTQALKYERELAEYDKRKQHDMQKFALNDLSVKSTPLSCQNKKMNTMTRKRRKRVEEATDTAAYMSGNNFFSSFSVNKKSYVDRPYMDYDFGKIAKPSRTNFTTDELGVSGGWPCLEFKDDNTLEEIFRKFDEAQAQVHMLKARMDKVIGEKAVEIVQNSSAPFNRPKNSAPKASPHIYKGPPGSLCITSHGRKDVIVPENAASSWAVPDMIESTDQLQVGLSTDKNEDGMLIYNNQHIKEEVDLHLVAKPQLTSEVQELNSAQPDDDAESASQSNKAASPVQRCLKMRSVSKLGTTKRKRGRRKARSKTYSRRSSA